MLFSYKQYQIKCIHWIKFTKCIYVKVRSRLLLQLYNRSQLKYTHLHSRDKTSITAIYYNLWIFTYTTFTTPPRTVTESRGLCVSGSRSSQPPCRCTVSTQHFHRRQSIAGWWRRACPAHSTVSQCLWSASGRWWWTARWRGWWASCSDPEGRGRSLCSGTRCSPGERRSIQTSRSPQSQRREASVGRTWTRLLPRCSPEIERCGKADQTEGPLANWKWLLCRLDLG